MHNVYLVPDCGVWNVDDCVIYLNYVLHAKYLRFEPITWNGWPSMRVEAYYNQASYPMPSVQPTSSIAGQIFIKPVINSSSISYAEIYQVNEYDYDWKCTFLPTRAPTSTVVTPYVYVGCFLDKTNRALEYWSQPQTNWANIDTCFDKCYTVYQYKYFALQAQGHCFCSNSYDLATQYGTSGNCPQSKLGGDWANDLFRVNIETLYPSLMPSKTPTIPRPSRAPVTKNPTGQTSMPTETIIYSVYPTVFQTNATIKMLNGYKICLLLFIVAIIGMCNV
eukprot:466531_1